MGMRIVTTATDFGLANILKGALESAGIDAELRGTDLQNVFAGTQLAPIDVLVPEEDFDRAQDLLDSFDEQGLPGEEEDEA
jgi:hypothetical protein